MVEIVWTEEALRWLQEIFTYISEDSPTAARKVVSGIYEKVQLLKEFPEIGYQYRSENEDNIRVLLYGHYRIAYLLKSTTRRNFGRVSWRSRYRQLFHKIRSG